MRPSATYAARPAPFLEAYTGWIMLRRTSSRIAIFALLCFCSATAVAAPITIRLDATEAARKIYHAELTIPAAPVPMTLFYPKWIPGEHAPTGPVTDLAGLKISAGNQTLLWKRDSVEMFSGLIWGQTGEFPFGFCI